MNIRRGVVICASIVALGWGIALEGQEAAAATIVKVSEGGIAPDLLTIERGDEVIWKAAVPAGPPHFKWMPTPKSVRVRVTEDGDFAVTFDVPGEYRYVIPIGRGGKGDDELPGKITVK